MVRALLGLALGALTLGPAFAAEPPPSLATVEARARYTDADLILSMTIVRQIPGKADLETTATLFRGDGGLAFAEKPHEGHTALRAVSKGVDLVSDHNDSSDENDTPLRAFGADDPLRDLLAFWLTRWSRDYQVLSREPVTLGTLSTTLFVLEGLDEAAAPRVRLWVTADALIRKAEVTPPRNRPKIFVAIPTYQIRGPHASPNRIVLLTEDRRRLEVTFDSVARDQMARSAVHGLSNDLGDEYRKARGLGNDAAE